MATRERSSRIAATQEAKKRKLEEEQAKKKPNGYVHWTPRDHESLLEGLKAVGSRHPGAIHDDHLNQVPAVNIKSHLLKWKKSQDVNSVGGPSSIFNGEGGGDQKSARPAAKLELSPIELWIQLVEKTAMDVGASRKPPVHLERSMVLPIGLDLISRHEPHPSVTKDQPVDYAAIYEVLASFCSGDAPRELDKASSAKLIVLMRQLLDYVKKHRNELLMEDEAIAAFRWPQLATLADGGEFRLEDMLNFFQFPRHLFHRRHGSQE